MSGEKTEPSSEWTIEERLTAIAELAATLQTAARVNSLNRALVLDVGERIILLATARPEVLEANRAVLLKPFEFEV